MGLSVCSTSVTPGDRTQVPQKAGSGGLTVIQEFLLVEGKQRKEISWKLLA